MPIDLVVLRLPARHRTSLEAFLCPRPRRAVDGRAEIRVLTRVQRGSRRRRPGVVSGWRGSSKRCESFQRGLGGGRRTGRRCDRVLEPLGEKAKDRGNRPTQWWYHKQQDGFELHVQGV